MRILTAVLFTVMGVTAWAAAPLPIQHNPFTTTTNDPAVTVAATQPVSITTASSNAFSATGVSRITHADTLYPVFNVTSPQGGGSHLSSYISSNATFTVGGVLNGLTGGYTGENPSVSGFADWHLGSGPISQFEVHSGSYNGDQLITNLVSFQPKLALAVQNATTFINDAVQIMGPSGNDLRIGVTNGAGIATMNPNFYTRLTTYYDANIPWELDSWGGTIKHFSYNRTVNTLTIHTNSGIVSLTPNGGRTIVHAPEYWIGPDGRWAAGATNLLGAPLTLHTADTTNFAAGLVLNNPHTFGVGENTASTALLFTRNRFGGVDDAVTNISATIEGGNKSETTSANGILRFKVESTGGTGLVQRIVVDDDNGVRTYGNFEAGEGPGLKIDLNTTANTLTTTNANVGIRTSTPDKALHVYFDHATTPAVKFGTGSDAQGWYGFLGNDSIGSTKVFTGNAMNDAGAAWQVRMRGTTEWTVEQIADQYFHTRYPAYFPSINATNGGTFGAMTGNTTDINVTGALNVFHDGGAITTSPAVTNNANYISFQSLSVGIAKASLGFIENDTNDFSIVVNNGDLKLRPSGIVSMATDMRLVNLYATNDVSALTFTDRSRAPTNLTEALAIVRSVESTNGRVNHLKLHRSAWGMTRTNGVVVPDQTKRDLGMVVSAQGMVIADLDSRVDKLEMEVKGLLALVATGGLTVGGMALKRKYDSSNA